MTVKRLWFHPLASIVFPNEENMQRFAEMISLRKLAISNIIGFFRRTGIGISDDR
jgi:hypothetical protein